MKEMLTQWMLNLTFFSLVTSILIQLLPGKNYIPYIRIFCGIVMILLFFQPVINLFGLEEEIEIQFMENFHEVEQMQMEQTLIQIEEEQKARWEEEFRNYRGEQDGVEQEN